MSTMLPRIKGDEATSAAHVRSDHTREESLNPSIAFQETITRPGAVRINFKGAFIVEEGKLVSHVLDADGPVHETSDIRLPHHTSVVSHVAVDVRRSSCLTMST